MWQAPPPKAVWLLGADDFDDADVPSDAFVVYQVPSAFSCPFVLTLLLPTCLLPLPMAPLLRSLCYGMVSLLSSRGWHHCAKVQHVGVFIPVPGAYVPVTLFEVRGRERVCRTGGSRLHCTTDLRGEHIILIE